MGAVTNERVHPPADFGIRFACVEIKTIKGAVIPRFSVLERYDGMI